MQPTNKVLQGQTFIDMVCQQAGSYEEIINAAILNGKSITDDVSINEIIKVTNVLNVENASILGKRRPATYINNFLTDDNTGPQLQGIGYWIIGDDNIVS